ncbi:AIPR family protein [Agrobacterium sp. CG674]
MSDNNETILKQVLATQREEIRPEMAAEDFFEVFTAEQATKEFELSYEEIEDGIVDGEHDGGIDSFYTFVNGEIATDELDVKKIPKKDITIDLIIVSSKSKSGFSEGPIDKMIASLQKLLNLNTSLGQITQYNDTVISKAEMFRSVYKGVVAKFPTLNVKIYYATGKHSGDVHANTLLKSKDLIDCIRGLFTDAHVTFNFWGPKEILALARTKPKQSFELKFEQSLNGSSGYVALVKLPHYFNFLKGGGDKVRADLFEANVRDYQGTTEVNSEISKTLRSVADDFWWFNNGVTVLASRATSSGSVITVENPQIVNGLQTSSEIASYFDESERDDTRSVMVKIVASENEEIRDRIIKATNNQNTVNPASLRATDKVQRDIEHHLKANGLFYDRRKNYYKNDGRPANKIISISLLAQAVMSLFRGQPDNARARPSTLIKEDREYSMLFSEDFPLDAYVVAADTIRRIEIALKGNPDLSPKDRNNIRFYVLYYLISLKAKSTSLSPQKVAQLKGEITNGDISGAISLVWELFEREGKSDEVAKGISFKGKIAADVTGKIKADNAFL